MMVNNSKHRGHRGSILDRFFNGLKLNLRAKLIVVLLVVKLIPIILLTVLALEQVAFLGIQLREIAVADSSAALNQLAVEKIELQTTTTAHQVATFLYERDSDILALASIEPSAEVYDRFMQSKQAQVIAQNAWVLDENTDEWVSATHHEWDGKTEVSTNAENETQDGFHYRLPDVYTLKSIPLYDEITFVDLNGREIIKVVAADSPKKNYPMNPELQNISDGSNTYVMAEDYWESLRKLEPGEIYVSDVIGAYVGSNYIGMYTPRRVAEAAAARGYDIEYLPRKQSYAGAENPYGQRFEGIIRWATPVTDQYGQIVGYVTFALNHDHIMEFVDHQTPMSERYTELPSAFEGNYAFIWDYMCRSIAHPRHNSIVGYDPNTGNPQVPWLESSIYDGWQSSGIEVWTDYIEQESVKEFDGQSRSKAPAAALTQAGLVGLDGRYLNNAPQCTGWMDLTQDGGSGSFYILWSGLQKLTTAAAIPYYTGQYAPSAENGFSQRGFGIVTIGAGLEDFTRPSAETGQLLVKTTDENLSNVRKQLFVVSGLFILLVVVIALAISSSITGNITDLIEGISRFRKGQRQFRFASTQTDEFGTLANSFDEMADSLDQSVKNPMAITDVNCNVLFMNRHGLTLQNRDELQVIGEFYFLNSMYPEGTRYDPILALEEGREAEVFLHEETGRYYRGVANYTVSQAGEKTGYIIESVDVTELEKALQTANEASRHKGDFLARMSHEIRTPMNAIIGLTNLVQKRMEQNDTKDIMGTLGQISASSQHLLSLLNDILDLSKIEAGKIELSEDVMDINQVLSTVVSMIQTRCSEKNISFVKSFDRFEPASVVGDSLRLRQVLINLLGNAVKFTPELGTVELEVKVVSRNEAKTRFRFAVKDTGIGISEASQEAIFHPFEQGDNKVYTKFGGTGLGLSISRSMVQLMGGDISLTSDLDVGSNFFFEIEFVHADRNVEEEIVIGDLTNKLGDYRILLVDDVDINRMIVSTMLEETGVAIDEAEDGLVAVEKFKASEPGTYDLILMDIQMPNLNGYDAATEIRSLDRSDAKTVPIAALTANAFQEDIAKAVANGMNFHIAKPVEMKELFEVIVRVFNMQGQ